MNKDIIMRFPERLKEAVGSESVRGFAHKCGLSESGLRKYLSGETYPPLDKLISISEAADRSFNWLCSGEEQAELDDSVFALIPGYNIQVSAGNGTVCHNDEKPFRHLAFRHTWLKSRGFNGEELVVVSAKGDSMEPVINNNDSLVIHIGRTIPRDGYIYVFRNDEELFVKRYQSMLGSWRLISDNPIYSPLDIPKHEQHQFEVIGQVVHIAKDVGN